MPEPAAYYEFTRDGLKYRVALTPTEVAPVDVPMPVTMTIAVDVEALNDAILYNALRDYILPDMNGNDEHTPTER